MPVPFKPDRYNTATVYLVVEGVTELIDFVVNAFDAEEIERLEDPDGNVMHAEVRIGDSIIMMGPPQGKVDLQPAKIHLYLEDADASYRRALDAGAISVREPADQFYGDRSGGVKDPFGNEWWIATHIEDVSPEEMKARFEKLMKEMSKE